MTGLEKLIEWWKAGGRNTDPIKLCSPASEIISKVQELLAEEQSQPPANADLVGYLGHEIDLLKNGQSHVGPFQEGMTYAYENILERYRPIPAVKEAPKEVKEQGEKKTPCTVSDFDCSGPCPYADKNRCIPCGYKKSDCPIHSVKEQGEAGWKECAAQMSRNAEYYRGLVIKIGAMFGSKAYIADDGSKSQDVLCAKVPELVEEVLKAPVPVDRTEEMVGKQKEAHNHGFHQGMALALISLGRGQDQPTLAKNIADGYGLQFSDFSGHGIDSLDMERLRGILADYEKGEK